MNIVGLFIGFELGLDEVLVVVFGAIEGYFRNILHVCGSGQLHNGMSYGFIPLGLDPPALANLQILQRYIPHNFSLDNQQRSQCLHIGHSGPELPILILVPDPISPPIGMLIRLIVRAKHPYVGIIMENIINQPKQASPNNFKITINNHHQLLLPTLLIGCCHHIIDCGLGLAVFYV